MHGCSSEQRSTQLQQHVAGGGSSGAAAAAAPAVTGRSSNPVPRTVDFDRMEHSDESSGRAGRSGGPGLLVWSLTAPSVLFYLMFFIMHWVPAAVTDSEGFTHSVRRRLTANFFVPWFLVFVIDIACLCPAHYWLTLYDATNTLEWKGYGNARGKVEVVAAAVGSLTRAEAIHFTSTLSPLFIGVIIDAVRSEEKKWFFAVFSLVILVVLLGGQRFFGLVGRPRAAIVRFRGPATPDYAWSALKGSLLFGLCVVVWGARCLQFWIDEPNLLFVAAPTNEMLEHPTTADNSYGADLWQGLECGGILTDDPAAPWLVKLNECPPEMFLEGGPSAYGSEPRFANATLPSQWTAQGFRRQTFMVLPTLWAGCGYSFFYLPIVGEGMFSSMRQLQYGWTEVLAAAMLVAWLLGALLAVRSIDLIVANAAQSCARLLIARGWPHVTGYGVLWRRRPSRLRLEAERPSFEDNVAYVRIDRNASVQGLHCRACALSSNPR
jgi:hypothetical protein